MKRGNKNQRARHEDRSTMQGWFGKSVSRSRKRNKAAKLSRKKNRK